MSVCLLYGGVYKFGSGKMKTGSNTPETEKFPGKMPKVIKTDKNSLDFYSSSWLAVVTPEKNKNKNVFVLKLQGYFEHHFSLGQSRAIYRWKFGTKTWKSSKKVSDCPQ